MSSRRRSAFTVVLLAGTTWVLLDACGGRLALDEGRVDDDGGPSGASGAGGGTATGLGPVTGPGTTTTTLLSTGAGGLTGTGTSGGVTTTVTGAGGVSTSTTSVTTGAAGFGTGSSGVSGVGGMGGAAGFGGGKGFGGAAGKAGSSGFGGSMGKAGAGGAFGCGKATCPAIGCAPGYVPVIPPGACCPTCVPAPCIGDCGPIMCLKGTHAVTPPGMCCPICVQDVPTCDQGEKAYYQFRSLLLDKYSSVGCMLDSECTLAYEGNRCAVSNCDSTPLAASIATSYVDNLRSFADTNCAACPPVSTQPCPFIPPLCIMGHCTFGPTP